MLNLCITICSIVFSPLTCILCYFSHVLRCNIKQLNYLKVALTDMLGVDVVSHKGRRRLQPPSMNQCHSRPSPTAQFPEMKSSPLIIMKTTSAIHRNYPNLPFLRPRPGRCGVPSALTVWLALENYRQISPPLQHYRDNWGLSNLQKEILSRPTGIPGTYCETFFTARCPLSLVQSAVLRLHVVCPSVCPSVRPWRWWTMIM